MRVTVNEQEQLFYLATEDGWEGRIGHEMRIGDYKFCIIPFDDHINVSEVSSGFNVLSVPYSDIDLMALDETSIINLVWEITQTIQMIIDRSDFDSIISRAKTDGINKLGEKPETDARIKKFKEKEE